MTLRVTHRGFDKFEFHAIDKFSPLVESMNIKCQSLEISMRIRNRFEFAQWRFFCKPTLPNQNIWSLNDLKTALIGISPIIHVGFNESPELIEVYCYLHKIHIECIAARRTVQNEIDRYIRPYCPIGANLKFMLTNAPEVDGQFLSFMGWNQFLKSEPFINPYYGILEKET